MKKIRTILTGVLLVLTLSVFTACGNNNAPADETGTAAEENTTDTEENKTDIEENNAEEFDIEELNNPNKDFYVKLNAKDDIIELYDSATDRLIETISGNELRELVKKLNMASGIFVNKKV